MSVPLKVTNNCFDTIWPGVGTQHGRGPGTGGFELPAGRTAVFDVSWNWQGRIWGRTNCTFNEDGTGPSQLNGVNRNGAACSTGDCFGRLDCQFTGAPPSTLAEFNLRGGVGGVQTFYDISLVDGYNLPVGIVYLPAANTTHIPPSLTNCACIATAGWLAKPARSGLAYTNATYPIPYERDQDNDGVGHWCPWDLQAYPPSKPGDGVYPYPDDNIGRPAFDPCRSTCAAYGSPRDCCTGDYNDPNVCKAGLYSQNAKAVCPDAYSFAFDDRTSTFIIPAGGGWEVVFCPEGRSTDILRTFGPQMMALASGGYVAREAMMLKHVPEPETPRGKTKLFKGSSGGGPRQASLGETAFAESEESGETTSWPAQSASVSSDGEAEMPAAAFDRQFAAHGKGRRSAGARGASCKQLLGAGLLVALAAGLF